MHHKEMHVDKHFKRPSVYCCTACIPLCMNDHDACMVHHFKISLLKWSCLVSLSPPTPNQCNPLLCDNLPLLVLPPLTLINRPLCWPVPWIRCFAAGIAQHTKPSIVYLVTNPVSLVVAHVFLLLLSL